MHDGKSPETLEKRKCIQSNLNKVNHLQNDGRIEILATTNEQDQNSTFGLAQSPFPYRVAQPTTSSQPENTLIHLNHPKDPSREWCSEEGKSYLVCSQPETTRDQQVNISLTPSKHVLKAVFTGWA